MIGVMGLVTMPRVALLTARSHAGRSPMRVRERWYAPLSCVPGNRSLWSGVSAMCVTSCAIQLATSTRARRPRGALNAWRRAADDDTTDATSGAGDDEAATCVSARSSRESLSSSSPFVAPRTTAMSPDDPPVASPTLALPS